MADSILCNNIDHLRKVIKTFNAETFNEFIFNVYVDGKSDILEHALATDKKKAQCVRTLDDCLARRSKGKPFVSEREIKFLQKFRVDELPNLIQLESRKFGINFLRPGFYVYYHGILKQLKQSYDSDRREVFEQKAKMALKGSDNYFGYKATFIKMFVNDPEYGLYWAKQLKLRRYLPDFVLKLKNKPKVKKNKSAQKSKKAPVSLKATHAIVSSECMRCTINGTDYRVFMVKTQEEFKKFINTYLMGLRNAAIGIDCEADPKNELALIQIAAKTLSTSWICLFDVRALTINLPQWKVLFEYIFGTKFERVGFAYEHDYKYLCKTFPSLLPVFQRAKVLCLKKLVEAILKHPNAKKAVFVNKELQSVSLAILAENVVRINLDKGLQRSDWSARPLTENQILYAAKDAAVLIEIKEKLEKAMLSLSLAERNELMMMGDFIGASKQENAVSNTKIDSFRNMQISSADRRVCCNKAKCNSSNTAIIPSPLYVLIYKLAEIQKCISDNVSGWQMVKNDAIAVKNIKPEDYNGFTFQVKFRISKKPSRALTFVSPEYTIRPLTSQVLGKKNGRFRNIQFSQALYSKPGTNYIMCLSCGNIFLQDMGVVSKVAPKISTNADLKTLQQKALTILRSVFVA